MKKIALFVKQANSHRRLVLYSVKIVLKIVLKAGYFLVALQHMMGLVRIIPIHALHNFFWQNLEIANLAINQDVLLDILGGRAVQTQMQCARSVAISLQGTSQYSLHQADHSM